jgi:hypothetical protein
MRNFGRRNEIKHAAFPERKAAQKTVFDYMAFVAAPVIPNEFLFLRRFFSFV